MLEEDIPSQMASARRLHGRLQGGRRERLHGHLTVRRTQSLAHDGQVAEIARKVIGVVLVVRLERLVVFAVVIVVRDQLFVLCDRGMGLTNRGKQGVAVSRAATSQVRQGRHATHGQTADGMLAWITRTRETRHVRHTTHRTGGRSDQQPTHTQQGLRIRVGSASGHGRRRMGRCQ